MNKKKITSIILIFCLLIILIGCLEKTNDKINLYYCQNERQQIKEFMIGQTPITIIS